MAPSSFRAAAGFALTLVASAFLPQQSAAQTQLSGVEQARADSIRRPYTAADIEFMAGMIGHHAQAVKMAGWAQSHGAGKSLQVFCGRIALGQKAEIGLMQGWLKDRNQPVPDADARGMKMAMGDMKMDMGDHAKMDMGGNTMHFMMMPGMLTEAQMAKLDAAHGVAFDRLFLQYMIQHHKGAVSMVEKLFNTPSAGQDEIVFKFANDVQADQNTEIDRMEQMLAAIKP